MSKKTPALMGIDVSFLDSKAFLYSVKSVFSKRSS